MVLSKMLTLPLERFGNHHADSHSFQKNNDPARRTNAKRGLSQPLSYLGVKLVNIVLPCVAFSNANPQSIQGGAA